MICPHFADCSHQIPGGLHALLTQSSNKTSLLSSHSNLDIILNFVGFLLDKNESQRGEKAPEAPGKLFSQKAELHQLERQDKTQQ